MATKKVHIVRPLYRYDAPSTDTIASVKGHTRIVLSSPEVPVDIITSSRGLRTREDETLEKATWGLPDVVYAAANIEPAIADNTLSLLMSQMQQLIATVKQNEENTTIRMEQLKEELNAKHEKSESALHERIKALETTYYPLHLGALIDEAKRRILNLTSDIYVTPRWEAFADGAPLNQMTSKVQRKLADTNRPNLFSEEAIKFICRRGTRIQQDRNCVAHDINPHNIAVAIKHYPPLKDRERNIVSGIFQKCFGIQVEDELDTEDALEEEDDEDEDEAQPEPKLEHVEGVVV